MIDQAGGQGGAPSSSGPSSESRPVDSPQDQLPTISVPKGGGALGGVGEKFSANPVTGGGSMTVPLAVSPGRNGFGPQLSLSYDSGAGNGPFGFGWSLSLPKIARKTAKGVPRYRDGEESDVFLLSDAEDLVPVLRENGTVFEDTATAPGFKIHRYRPRTEGLYSRIERWSEIATGDVHWRSITRDNLTSIYGENNDSRIFDPAEGNVPNPKRVFEWLICKSFDDRGNAIVYDYVAENDIRINRMRPSERNRVRTANRYLKRVKYGNRVSLLVQPDLAAAQWLFEIVFDYGEDHYAEVPLDLARPAAEQHRFSSASVDPEGVWEVRPDPFSSYRSGFEVRSYRRCSRVLMFHRFDELGPEPCLVRSTEFDYDDLDFSQPVTVQGELSHSGSTRYASFIRRVTETGFVRDAAAPVEVRNTIRFVRYLQKSLPPLEFDYTKAEIQDEIRALERTSRENLPIGVDGDSYKWVDLDGEGVSGVLTKQGGAWQYKANLGDGSFSAMQVLRTQPSLFSKAVSGERLLDLSGDGQLDVVSFSGPLSGFYERTLDEDWQPFRSFRQLPNIRWDDPNTRFVDLNGDGHADVLISEHDVFTWHTSLAEDGFGPADRVPKSWDEELGPRLVFSDGTQSVYLADMSGDSLTDLVRIRNGEACYWPNLAYGRFGPKVAMDNAPFFDSPDEFDQRRVRLADIDGSGTNDIIYLGKDRVRLYFNQSGNAWSEAHALQSFPKVDNLSTVSTVDLLGNGTACLVWSSPTPSAAQVPIRYVDLMGGQKPHLLTKSTNHLGAETHVQYAPSTKFYLKDKREGKPWITRIPFPVHVIERIETYDRISRNRFVTRYAYHHGYFDGHEREFRGFGLVEQFDSEEFASFSGSNVFPTGDTIENSSHVPPVLTRTWFHTGVYVGREHVSNFYAGLVDSQDTGEYFREPGLPDAQARELLLADTVLPTGLTTDEEREACRALRGSLLRQEIYALDDSEKELLPYAVTERNYDIRHLQARGSNRHAIFSTYVNEEVVYNYERTLVPVLGNQIVDEAAAAANSNVEHRLDPRIVHTLTLEVDDFGNVLKSATVSYGRRFVNPALTQPILNQQATTHVIYSEVRVTNSIDAGSVYRTPMAYDARNYQLTGYLPSGPSGRFGRLDFVNPIPANPGTYAATFDDELDFHEQPTLGRQRRIVEHSRTLFRRDDLVAELPLGQLESMALPFETYNLAFTPGLVAQIFGGRVTNSMLEGSGPTPGGRYVHVHDENNLVGDEWWAPSGRVFFSPGSFDTPVQELAHARQHFFLSHRARDPFHTPADSTEAFVLYDDYDVMVRETRNPVGNRVTAGERNVNPVQPLVSNGNDYRVLQPRLLMDANRNRIAISYDALGLAVGTAVMGKPEDNPVHGDRLTVAFRSDLTEAEVDAFLNAPTGPFAAQLLAEATTRIIRDPTMYWREADPTRKQPSLSATLARETHAADPLPPDGLRILASLAYSDGFGREIQTHVQVEPGPVPVRDGAGVIVLGADDRPQMTPNNVSPRWASTGSTVFNNKGKPVRQYESHFTDRHRFEFDVRIGVSPVLFYDPLSRVVARLHPNHVWEKVVFGPWREEAWDPSDTALEVAPNLDGDVGDFFARLPNVEYLPTWHARRQAGALGAQEQDAARKSEIHAGTPTVAHYDALGRKIATIAHNRFKYSNAPPADPPIEEFYESRAAFDIEGNQEEVVDANGRIVVHHDYDMLGRRVHQASMEAGERWMFNDVSGKSVYHWNSRGHRFRSEYDALRRLTNSYLSDGAGPELLVGQNIYGESRANPEAANLREKLVEQFDQSGVVLTEDFDFKGNPLRSSRQLVQAYDATVDWSVSVPRQAESYISQTRYDAFDRPTQLVVPHSDQPGAKINVVQPIYNDASHLERMDVWLDHGNAPNALVDSTATPPSSVGIANIDYDAKGQRLKVDYRTTDPNKQISTRYDYDPETLRLSRLYTRRGADFTEDCENPQPPPATIPAPEVPPAGVACGVQNLHYTYDPAGNITHVRDSAQQTIFFDGMRVDPVADYTYDANYRLIEATGREHLGQLGVAHSYNDSSRVGQVGIPHPNDGQAMGRYLERYLYDAVGNIQSMQHRGTSPRNPGWSQSYAYAEPSQIETGEVSNRLTRTTHGAMTNIYSTAGDGYDEHGNMLRMPQLQAMQWNERDQLQMSQRQAVNPQDEDGVASQGERTWYVYDAAGQRVRKVTERAGGQVKDERIYLGGFEIYRKLGANGLTRESLHIMDDKQRIALVETRTQGNEPGIPAEVIRYQLSNQLGSASLELDEQARVVSYEEYTPFGSSTYQAVSSQTQVPKRYRYAGKERDEESGLYNYGARLFAPWLARWTSCDPGGYADGTNLYAYVRNNPIRYADSDGRGAWDFVKGVAAGAAVAVVVVVAVATAPITIPASVVTGLVVVGVAATTATVVQSARQRDLLNNPITKEQADFQMGTAFGGLLVSAGAGPIAGGMNATANSLSSVAPTLAPVGIPISVAVPQVVSVTVPQAVGGLTSLAFPMAMAMTGEGGDGSSGGSSDDDQPNSSEPEPDSTPGVKDQIDNLPEEQYNRLVSRVVRGGKKGRAFGTQRNPNMPTVDEFNPRVENVRAGDLDKSIKTTRHGIFPEQAESVGHLTNKELVKFRIEDPISGTGSSNNISLTGGHHRSAEIIRRVAAGELSADAQVSVMFHD